MECRELGREVNGPFKWHWHTPINLLRIISLCYKIWNIWEGGLLSQQWEDFHLEKKIVYNYGQCNKRNHMYKCNETISETNRSMATETLIYEIHYKYSRECFEQIYVNTTRTQEINTIFINQKTFWLLF